MFQLSLLFARLHPLSTHLPAPLHFLPISSRPPLLSTYVTSAPLFSSPAHPSSPSLSPLVLFPHFISIPHPIMSSRTYPSLYNPSSPPLPTRLTAPPSPPLPPFLFPLPSFSQLTSPLPHTFLLLLPYLSSPALFTPRFPIPHPPPSLPSLNPPHLPLPRLILPYLRLLKEPAALQPSSTLSFTPWLSSSPALPPLVPPSPLLPSTSPPSPRPPNNPPLAYPRLLCSPPSARPLVSRLLSACTLRLPSIPPCFPHVPPLVPSLGEPSTRWCFPFIRFN
ncbi:unnamed protein product [Closterium sp. Naga37s-1]|nr:unnamed protein product [Closterium sp. Naga37s-1]